MRPLWDLTAPATDDDLLDKFRGLASRYLVDSNVAKELEETIWGIEELSSVSSLVEILAKAEANGSS